MTDRRFSILDIARISNRLQVCAHGAHSITEKRLDDPGRTELLETVLSMFCDTAQELAELALWADSHNCELLPLDDYERKPKARAELEKLDGIQGADNQSGAEQ